MSKLPKNWEAEVHKVVLGPIVLAIGTLVTGMAASAYLDRQRDRQDRRASAEAMLNSELKSLTQEVFMDQASVYERRLQIVAAQWNARERDSELCLGIVFSQTMNPRPSLVRCSRGANNFTPESGGTFRRELTVAGTSIATLVAEIREEGRYLDFLTPFLAGTVIAAFLLAMAFQRLLTRRFQRSIVSPLLARIAETERAAAIGKTVQMLAHDVRRPFSMMRALLDVLASPQTGTDLRETALRMRPTVERATQSVEGMLKDIMIFGEKPALSTETVTVEALLYAALRQAFEGNPANDVSLTFQLATGLAVKVDEQKIARVIVNIVENAAQAMGGVGRIWISAAAVGERFVELAIRNEGSCIAREDLDQVFETFFTKGKRSGTGLGLAIARHLITAHGGKIHCESDKILGVTFRFTLPLSPDSAGRELPRPVLPQHSKEFGVAVEPAARVSSSGMRLVDAGAISEDELAREIEGLGRSLRILHVDDDPFYRKSIEFLLARSPKLRAAVTLNGASSFDEALALVRREPFDLLILDIDLGEAAGTGIDLVESAGDALLGTKIYVQSNSDLETYREAAEELGIAALTAKPMPHELLLKMLRETLPIVGSGDVAREVRAGSSGRQVLQVPTGANTGPVVALVEDNILIREAWESGLGRSLTLLAFESPSALLAAADNDATLFERLDCVFIDLYYDDVGFDQHGRAPPDGVGLARAIRPRTNAALVSASDADLSAEERACFDSVIGKDPPRLDEVNTLLRNHRAVARHQERQQQ